MAIFQQYDRIHKLLPKCHNATMMDNGIHAKMYRAQMLTTHQFYGCPIRHAKHMQNWTMDKRHTFTRQKEMCPCTLLTARAAMHRHYAIRPVLFEPSAPCKTIHQLTNKRMGTARA